MNDNQQIANQPPGDCSHDWKEEINPMALRCVKCQWRKDGLSGKYGPPLENKAIGVLRSEV